MPLSKIKCRQKTKGQVSKASFLSFKKLFFLSAVILTFSESSPLFARKVTLPVHGLMVASPTPVPIEVEWDENWFLQSKTSEYNHKIARIAVLLSEISYVLVEKNPESNEMLRTYRELGFKDSDIEWNYILDYTAKDSGNNQVAFSFAKKIIQSNEGSKTLILAALRGTPLSANEWISNINISDSTHKNVAIHEGFEKTATNLKSALYDYLKKNKINEKEAVFLITGHSRGAALANLLGATLADEGIISPSQLFVYTFAAPNVSQEERTLSPEYNFIWNIVNAEDMIPSVPPNRNNWKWKKFGNTRILVNYWNCDTKQYSENYIPRMNEYFKKLLLRTYAPFKNGPFFQIQLARILTNLYPSVESYYRSFFGLRNMAEKIFWKAFPEKDESESPSEQKNEDVPRIVRAFQKGMNENIDGGFEYAVNALVDMHACESYLSWLLALNENEVYSTLGSSEIVLDGSYDLAVYDENGNMLAKVLDGSAEIYKTKTPVAIMPLPTKNVIGFPGNKNLNVVVHKDSLIPSVFSYTVAQYDASGTFLGNSSEGHIFPHAGRVVCFEAGKLSLESGKIFPEKLSRKDSKSLIKKYNLKQNIKFKIQPEFSYSSARIVSLGFRTGNQELYGTILGDIYTIGKNNYGFALGLGHQQSLYGRFLLDAELFSHFVWFSKYSEGKASVIVPEGRLSISYKPRHRLHFFFAPSLSCHIDDFNDEAFVGSVRRPPKTDFSVNKNLTLVPSLQFGIRF